MERRLFLKLLGATGVSTTLPHERSDGKDKDGGGGYAPARITNEYSAFLPGEREALAHPPAIVSITVAGVRVAGGREIPVNGDRDGWRLLVVTGMNGVPTAVFEKHVTYRGAIAYVTVDRGTIALIPKGIGDLAKIRPRQIAAPTDKQLRQVTHYVPGPDVPGNYILDSNEDPCYENVAALGAEYIGWTLIANERGGLERSLFLEPDGTSREKKNNNGHGAWAPDELGAIFSPQDLFPNDNVHLWRYEPGYSKRTLLGGYTPTADIGVWNQQYSCGYEVMALLPNSDDAKVAARVRTMLPDDQVTPTMHVVRDEHNRAFVERYVNATAASFFEQLAGIWNQWNTFFEESMPVSIPDEWLLESARAGIMLSRCSYRGLEPTYQIGEGAYTKIPERSHALFPVAEYEFIWAHQLWNLTASSDDYFQYYLDKYVLPDGNLLYNVQDQAEGPLNVGLFLANSARGYLFRRDLEVFRKRLPILRRMTSYVLARYEYAKRRFPPTDPHYGLIWGSPEADLGDPQNEFPDAHPYFYQNAACVWRGLQEHARALAAAAVVDPSLAAEASEVAATATAMRGDIERSLRTTLAAASPEMRQAGITPFTPEDTHRDSKQLLSYENHRFMQDWFLADWGDPELDRGHLRHRELSGMQVVGLHVDGGEQKTSNFMEHGTLAVKIRQDSYRSFLLTLYGLVCFAADSGNRYSPEDALLPGGRAGEGNRYAWSAVINSVLQPTLGLRWLLFYEESDSDICHLQKAVPKHWFREGERISVRQCPTRFGPVSWETVSLPGQQWRVKLLLPEKFAATLKIYIRSANGRVLESSSLGRIINDYVLLSVADLAGRRDLTVQVQGT